MAQLVVGAVIVNDGEHRRELDYLVEVESDPDAPRLERPTHVVFACVGGDELDRLMENRTPGQTIVRDIVAGGLQQAMRRQLEP
jgi:8-oxo-dGTP diphosphatase